MSNGGKLPFNFVPFIDAAYNQIQLPKQQQSFAGSEGWLRQSHIPSNGGNLPGNKDISVDELIKQVNRQIQKQEKPETDTKKVDS